MKRLFHPILILGGLVLGTCLADADDKPVPGTGFGASHYETLWTKSPFAVASAEAAPDSTDYSLVGIAQFDGVTYASLIDKATNQSFLLSSDKPVRGLTLTSVTRGQNASDTTAIVQRNGEAITLKLEQAQPTAVATNMSSPLPGQVPQIQMPMPGAGGMATSGIGQLQRPPPRFRRNIRIPPYPGAAPTIPVIPSPQGQSTPPPPPPPPTQP